MTCTELRQNKTAPYYNAVLGILLIVTICASLRPDLLLTRGPGWVILALAIYALIGQRDGLQLLRNPRRYGRHLLQVLAFGIGIELITSYIDYSQSEDAALSVLLEYLKAHAGRIYTNRSVLLMAAAAYAVGIVIGSIRHMLTGGEIVEDTPATGPVQCVLEALGTLGRHPLLTLALYRCAAYYAFLWEEMPTAIALTLQCLHILALICILLRLLQIGGCQLCTEDTRVIDAIGAFYRGRSLEINQAFYVALGVMLTIGIADETMLRGYTNGTFYDVLYVVAENAFWVIALLRFWNAKSRSRTIVQCLMLAIGMLLWYLNDLSSLLLLCVLIVAAEGTSARRILRMHIIIAMIIMAIAAWASLNGYIMYYDLKGKHAMGVVYPTAYAGRWLFLLITYRILRHKRMSLPEYAVWICIELYVYHLSGGKTAIACEALFLMMSYIADYLPTLWRSDRVRRWICRAGLAVYPLCGAAIAMSSLIVGKSLVNAVIDGNYKMPTLMHRLRMGYIAFQQYPLRLLSQNVPERGNRAVSYDYMGTYFYLDSTYMRCLVIYGLAFLFLIMGIYIYLMARSGRERNMMIWAALVVIAIDGITENFLMSVEVNILPILMYAAWDMGQPGLMHAMRARLERHQHV